MQNSLSMKIIYHVFNEKEIARNTTSCLLLTSLEWNEKILSTESWTKDNEHERVVLESRCHQINK